LFRSVSHGSLVGFVEVEKLVFGTRSTVVVDPTEERIKSEFEGVKRTFLPLHSVLRIDEVEKQGVSKITNVEGGNVAQFPVTMYSRSEEHTSELQSRENLVCRLLLEKKNYTISHYTCYRFAIF